MGDERATQAVPKTTRIIAATRSLFSQNQLVLLGIRWVKCYHDGAGLGCSLIIESGRKVKTAVGIFPKFPAISGIGGPALAGTLVFLGDPRLPDTVHASGARVSPMLLGSWTPHEKRLEMRNLERVLKHLDNLDDKTKAERVAALLRSVEQWRTRLQEAVSRREAAEHLEDEDQPPP